MRTRAPHWGRAAAACPVHSPNDARGTSFQALRWVARELGSKASPRPEDRTATAHLVRSHRAGPLPPVIDAVENRDPPTRCPLLSVLKEDDAVLAELLTLVREYQVLGKQVHDANIVATMLANGIGQLATLNFADFRPFEEEIAIEPPVS
jgi:predicted nucleic acid-binding protein